MAAEVLDLDIFTHNGDIHNTQIALGANHALAGPLRTAAEQQGWWQEAHAQLWIQDGPQEDDQQMVVGDALTTQHIANWHYNGVNAPIILKCE